MKHPSERPLVALLVSVNKPNRRYIMAKKLVFVWSDPKVRVNMNEVMTQRNFAPCHSVQHCMFTQPQYRNKVENELLVFGTSIDTIGMVRALDLKKQEPELRYLAVNIENVPQEQYHTWSTHLLEKHPDLMFFDQV
jgi:hypothetical protein